MEPCSVFGEFTISWIQVSEAKLPPATGEKNQDTCLPSFPCSWRNSMWPGLCQPGKWEQRRTQELVVWKKGSPLSPRWWQRRWWLPGWAPGTGVASGTVQPAAVKVLTQKPHIMESSEEMAFFSPDRFWGLALDALPGSSALIPAPTSPSNSESYIHSVTSMLGQPASLSVACI